MSRILVVESSGDLRGSERALLDLLDVVKDAQIAVCCPPGRPLLGELEKRRVKILPYFIYKLHGQGKLQRFRAAIGIVRACAEFRPEVIYLNQSGVYRVVLPASMIFGLPIVAHVRLFEHAAYLARQNPSPRRVRSIVAISHAVGAEIRRFSQLKAIHVDTIYDGFLPAPCVGTVARIPGRIACVGSIEPDKGQDVLISAMGILSKLSDTAVCLFAGDGDEEYCKELRKRARDLHLEQAIQWLGFVGDVPSLMRSCSVVVCPSRREGLGRVILEGWEAGCVPVVFGGSGGAAEIVQASKGGIVYAEQTPESLAEAVARALSLSDAEKSEMVAAGRAWTARNCDPSAYGLAMAAVLTSAGELALGDEMVKQ